MKKFIRTIAIIAGLFSFAACSLEEDSSGVTVPDKFFNTTVQIRAALNGCYDPLNGIHNFQYFIAVEGANDLAHAGNNSQKDAKLDINPASPGAATNVWRRTWTGIRYCLSTLAGIERSPLSDSEKMPYYVECRILLSYYYYILTSFFGDVPFYEDYIENEDDMLRIAKLGRMSAEETRNTLIEELKLYVPSLPQIRTCDQQYNYCGAAMGWMLIAKMAAWNKKWDDVIYACEHLEAMYGSLSQYPYSDVCFRNKFTPESIFEINHEYVEGAIDYSVPDNLAISAVVLPQTKTAGTDIFDGVSIPEVGDKATCYTPVRPTPHLKDDIAPANTGDVRRDFNISRSWNGVNFPSNHSWMGHKFWCFGVYQNQDSNNYKIFRYADALLLLAEAWCEKGNYSKSVEYLNMVRSRAQISNYVFVGAIKLRGEIRDERARELFGEFGRKYDLVRWGIWYDQVVAYNTSSLVQQFIRPCHRFYPIPDAQCAISGGVLSNPEYDRYNLTN